MTCLALAIDWKKPGHCEGEASDARDETLCCYGAPHAGKLMLRTILPTMARYIAPFCNRDKP